MERSCALGAGVQGPHINRQLPSNCESNRMPSSSCRMRTAATLLVAFVFFGKYWSTHQEEDACQEKSGRNGMAPLMQWSRERSQCLLGVAHRLVVGGLGYEVYANPGDRGISVVNWSKRGRGAARCADDLHPGHIFITGARLTLPHFVESRCSRYADYDFREADELFIEGGRTEEPEAGSEEVDEEQYATAPQSSIGYEVACGLRNGRRRVLQNETLNSSGNRIVGGKKASPGEFPWQVSLQLLAGWVARHICGGAIVSSYWVVTAGHCIADLKPSAITVVAGDHDLFAEEGTEQRVKVVRIINGGYKSGDFTKDIAMLQLASPLKLIPKRVAPVCLPQMHKKYAAGEFALVAGWGKLSEEGELPNILHYALLPIMAPNRCRKLYEEAGYGRYMNKCQICGGYDRGGVDSCQGDSGGPLVCRHEDKRYYLCGVVSFGVGCARPKLPGVYTEISCYSNWVKAILYNVNNYVSNLPAYDKNEN